MSAASSAATAVPDYDGDGDGTNEEESIVHYNAVIQGLVQKPFLNGRVGYVQRALSNGRFAIQILEPWTEPGYEREKDHPLSLRRENFVTGVDKQIPFHACLGCSINYGDDYLHKCSKCRRVRYCSRECQRKHWPVHKEQCHILRQSRKAKDDKELQSIVDPEERMVARMARAALCVDKDDVVGAEREYRRVLEESYDYVLCSEVYYKLGKAVMDQDREEEAIELFQKSIESFLHPLIDGQWVIQAHNVKAVLLHKSRGDVEGAIAEFKATLRLDPSDASANRWLPQFEKALVTGVLERPS